MANTYLQKQTALAKKIRKAHPNKKWTDCVKQAARELKKGSVSKPVRKKVGAYKVIEKGETVKTKPKAIYQITRAKKGTFKKGGVKKISGFNNLTEINSVASKLTSIETDILQTQVLLRQTKDAGSKRQLKAKIANRKKQFLALKKYFNTIAVFKSNR